MAEHQKSKTDPKNVFQIVWGIALVLAGAGIFFTMPQKLAEMEKIGFSPTIVSFCFYLIAVLLIGGGLKKIYHNYLNPDNKSNDGTSEQRSD
jgi:choline-glycine betaine transporter